VTVALTTAVITTTKSGRATVEFRYGTDIIGVVRGIPGRQWHPRRRNWSIPARHVHMAVEAFSLAGYQVAVDGQLQTGPGLNPFAVLRASMPPSLWDKCFRSLRQDLRPEYTGDERLCKLLMRAYHAGLADQGRLKGTAPNGA
jgi:hypothetical protein